MLILLIGDLHIPSRALDIPVKLKKLLVPGRISQILCTGNLVDHETSDFLQTVAPDVHFVKGDFDQSRGWPLSRVIAIDSFRIGLIHGHTVVPRLDSDALHMVARQMDVDVLVWGGTHRFEAYEWDGKLFVNPGSATGALYTGWETEEPIPTFVLMSLQTTVLVLYVYQLIGDDIKVEKLQYPRGKTENTN
ncbi:hypothetical protein PNEG_02466 [Pneumocystis murina B123]|uniref:Vacuolar protein sorting-associated protein 29 n=1 Tax=Pneumocystis murina (strain B123) TaxID=1069680 RepID=M7NKF9_PNEMU|nr:hypothetical protein PNEG_02466 [Pneumocystis murina B123]EMR09123.1 hypothetical protein PNEG_02466 [Pneumocystis murina B123]